MWDVETWILLPILPMIFLLTLDNSLRRYPGLLPNILESHGIY